jgi:beta-lactamase superfamily II metal-dependent hydrolase
MTGKPRTFAGARPWGAELPRKNLTATFGTALGILLGAQLFAAPAAPAGRGAALEIYFIDVEGGQSTLIVTPDRHSLLIDTGWAGNGTGFNPGNPRDARDANRIVAAARDAGIKRIDYLYITHFHTDHDGGVKELSQLMPIGAFIDHGAPSEGALSGGDDTKKAFAAYSEVRAKGQHIEPKPGDRLPLADVEAIVVATAGAAISRPLPKAGEANPVCQDHAIPAGDTFENPRSTGVVIRYGQFRFLDLGDLTGQPLFDLACPKNLVGPVDAYLVAHHGGPDAYDPATFAAFKPRVAIMNNGLKKGGAQVTYQTLHHIADLEDVWQVHSSAAAGDQNFAPSNIANLDESTSYWIKLAAQPDGSFRVFNQRTGEWKNYPARSH